MIRILTADDAAAYQALRLHGLRESPAAFGSTYENEVDIPLPDVAERLARGAGGEDVVFGAFEDGGALVGVIALHRQTGPKSRHRASVWGMYVAPQARGRGIGRALLDAVIAHARTLPGLERLALGVESGNEAARALYHACGFVTWGIEPQAYAQDGRYWDSELMSLAIDRTSGQ